jgi:hypothetical protein
MKHIESYRVWESRGSRLADTQVDDLPSSRIFDDAKRIDQVFGMSKRSWSETAQAFELGRDRAELLELDLDTLQITQPSIRSSRVKWFIDQVDSLDPIPVVEFSDGERVVFDGHHRLVANWALGRRTIPAYLVKLY